jgi:hypothetical protein
MQDGSRPQSLAIADMVNGPVGDGAPRHKRPDESGYGDKVGVLPKVGPTTVAEAEKGELSTVRQRTIKIPDLFSTITDPKKMTVGSPDRELINNIIANIGLQQTSSWREKIAKLQSYVNNLKNFSDQKTDVTQLISGLIFINLFKKLAFFMDQPGKQFEYLFLPFLDPKASVRGSEASELIDVSFGDQAYSLKFLKSAEPIVRGSRGNLVANNGTATYIVCRLKPGTGRLEFAEFLVSFDTGIINKGQYKPFKTSENANSVWLYSESGGGVPRFVCLVDTKIETVRALNANAGLSPPAEIKREKESVQKINVGGLEMEPKKLSNIITNLPANIRSAKEKATKKDAAGVAKETETIVKTLSQFPDFETEVKNKNSIKELEDFILSIRQQIKDALEKKSLREELLQEASDQFEFPIQGIWNSIAIKDVYIDFGNPEDYGKQTTYIAGAINNFYVDLLDNLEQLSTNVTNFVATSSDTQKGSGSQTYAIKSMKNATDIKNNILDIKKSQTK